MFILILLTARGCTEDVITGLEAGADEYLAKPFDPYELKARLRSGVRIVELQDRLIQAQETLRDQAMHDPSTHLLNRRATFDVLLSKLSRADRKQNSLTMMMVDIDDFKSVNDRFGHLAGDEVLREVARRLRMSTRKYDAVGRIGGKGIPGSGARLRHTTRSGAGGAITGSGVRAPHNLQRSYYQCHDQRGSYDYRRSQPARYGSAALARR